MTEILKKYMVSKKYELSIKSKFTKILDSFVFSYINSSGNKDNIKIEINYGLNIHVLEVETRNVNNGIDNFDVIMLDKIELYASKITALLNRGAPRDLFDINNMIENDIIKESEQEYLRKCIIFYSIITNNENELFRYESFEKIDLKKIKSELYPVLQKGVSFDLNNAKSSVIKYLDKLLVINDCEAKFIKEFYQGNVNFTLLFDDEQIVNRLKNHKMILWKISHIREYIKAE